MERNKKNSLILGGDSANELKFSGKKSTGGGSALYYLSNNPLPVLEAMKRNRLHFFDKFHI